MATRKKKSRVSRALVKRKLPNAQQLYRQQIAAAFDKLSEASGLFFKDQTDFLITEQSAHLLLTRTFTMLSNATRAGRLGQAANGMLKGAKDYRLEMLPELKSLQAPRANLPVFGEINGDGLVKKIQGCINPTVPDAFKTRY